MNIEVRKCTGRDIKAMRGKLREEDVLEIKRRSGRDPYKVLVSSYRLSKVAFVGIVDGEIACAWGVAKESILAPAAQIWLLSTSVMEKAPVAIARRSRKELRKLLICYPVLDNYVDAEYKLCIGWLEWLGFTVGKPEPLGVNGECFCHFYIVAE